MDLRRQAYRTVWAFHRTVDRLTRGRVDLPIGPPTLWLTTTGRKTGMPRTNGLFFVRHGAAFVVGASNAASESDPAWWLNLQAQPEAEVRHRRSRVRVRAHRASASEELVLWPKLERMFPAYRGYRQRMRREIPVVVLEPVAESDA